MTGTPNAIDNVSKASVTKEVGSAATEASGALSREVFSDPKTFLTTLNSDLHKIEPADDKSISKQQLLDFAANPTDTANERAAANIAYNHYDQLIGMSHLPLDGTPALYNSSASTMLDVTKPNIGWGIAETEVGLGSYFIGSTLATAAGLALSSVVEIPPVVAIGGALALSGGTGMAATGYALYKTPGAVRDLAKQDKAALSSWNEINGKAS
jgi:hypothetical protein